MPHNEPPENLEAMARALEDQPVVDPNSGQALPTVASQPSAPASDTSGAATVSGTPEGEPPGTPTTVAEVPAPAIVGSEEPVAEGELTLTEDESAALERLGTFLEQAQEQERRELTGKFDRQFNKFKEDKAAETKALREEIRRIQEQGLTDAEKEALHQTWAYEDKQKELDEYSATLDAQYKDIMILTLTQEYGKYGVTEAQLADFDDPDEMEGFCKDEAIKFLGSGRSVQTAQPVKGSAPAAPPGARAPVDVGGNPPAMQPTKVNTEQGMDAMADNFKNLKVERVRVG